jgi:hypothetical protein
MTRRNKPEPESNVLKGWQQIAAFLSQREPDLARY